MKKCLESRECRTYIAFTWLLLASVIILLVVFVSMAILLWCQRRKEEKDRMAESSVTRNGLGRNSVFSVTDSVFVHNRRDGGGGRRDDRVNIILQKECKKVVGCKSFKKYNFHGVPFCKKVPFDNKEKLRGCHFLRLGGVILQNGKMTPTKFSET